MRTCSPCGPSGAVDERSRRGARSGKGVAPGLVGGSYSASTPLDTLPSYPPLAEEATPGRPVAAGARGSASRV